VYENKKSKKKRMPRKTIIFFGAVILVTVVLITGLIVILTAEKSLEDTIVDMPFSAASSHYTVGQNIVYSDQELLTCINPSLSTVWKLRLFSGGLDFTANDDIIAATGQGVIQVINAQGQHLFSTQLDGDIESARVGKDMAAVYIRQHLDDKTPSYIIVFNLSGEQLFLLDVTDRYVMDYGFDAVSDALYVLELDVSGSVPISRISTYKPDTQAITMIKELKDQLVSAVYWIDDKINAIGTTYLTVYGSMNAEIQQIMTYGWMLEDVYQNDDPKFIYVPSNSEASFDIARVVRTTGSEIKINLPPGVFRILHEGEKIYCFAKEKLFVYTGEGKYLRTYDLPYAIDGVERTVNDSVLLKHGETISLMPLP
jgi:hypothetical protein